MKKKFFYILLIIIISQGLGSKISIAAIDNYSLLEPLPCIDGTGNGCEGGTVKNVNVNTYIAYAFKIAIAMAGFLAVVMVIYGGFKYMLSESITSKGDAKSTINNAVLGLLGVLASYLILQTIDPRLVEINTTIPKIAIKSDGTVNSFLDQLSKDIRELSATQRDNVAKIQTEINNLTQKKKEIEDKISKGEGSAEDLSLEKYQIESQLKASQIKLSEETALSLGGTNFQLAISTAYRESSYLDTQYGDDTNTILLNYKIKIEEQMDRYAAKIENLGDPDAVMDVRKHKTFYLDQIEVEKKFLNDTTSYVFGSAIIKERVEKFLENMTTEKNIIFSTYKNYPDILSQYEGLEKTRRDRANKMIVELNKDL